MGAVGIVPKPSSRFDCTTSPCEDRRAPVRSAGRRDSGAGTARPCMKMMVQWMSGWDGTAARLVDGMRLGDKTEQVVYWERQGDSCVVVNTKY